MENRTRETEKGVREAGGSRNINIRITTLELAGVQASSTGGRRKGFAHPLLVLQLRLVCLDSVHNAGRRSWSAVPLRGRETKATLTWLAECVSRLRCNQPSPQQDSALRNRDLARSLVGAWDGVAYAGSDLPDVGTADCRIQAGSRGCRVRNKRRCARGNPRHCQ